MAHLLVALISMLMLSGVLTLIATMLIDNADKMLAVVDAARAHPRSDADAALRPPSTYADNGSTLRALMVA